MPDRALILVVDDSEADLLLIRKAFAQAQIPNPLYTLNSGDEAIMYLQGEGRYSNREEYPLPDLLLLDLKMPGVDGFEVLQWIRSQSGLSNMRVVVLTSSDQMRDVNQAYQLGANSFMVKSADFDNFVKATKSIQTYWMSHSKSPDAKREPRRRGEEWRLRSEQD